mmetsp:Transcript_11611/g.35805  ORF Transcript_11611/g.35805 Transcript_11611/m.35805 type:complete len:228 (-) Transcript_11611:220-903(-)
MSSYECARKKTRRSSSSTNRNAPGPCCGAVPTTRSLDSARTADRRPRAPAATANSSSSSENPARSPSKSSKGSETDGSEPVGDDRESGANTAKSPFRSSASHGRHLPFPSRRSSAPATAPRRAMRSSSTARSEPAAAWLYDCESRWICGALRRCGGLPPRSAEAARAGGDPTEHWDSGESGESDRSEASDPRLPFESTARGSDAICLGGVVSASPGARGAPGGLMSV